MDHTPPLTKKEKRELRKIEKQEERTKEAKSHLLQKIFLWSFGLLLLIGAFFLVRKSASVSPNLPDLNLTTVAVTDHVKGKESAKHLLIEYSDFQCPACAAYSSLLSKLVKEYPDNVRLVYRHFPLRQIHQAADLAAAAAEAAGKQNKFWEMHDMLFAKQTEWADKSNAKELFTSYAQTLSLTIDQFKTDLESAAIKASINNQYLSAIQANLNYTPTFFLDGKLVTPKSYDEFVQLIN